jgi:hypothetical protein
MMRNIVQTLCSSQGHRIADSASGFQDIRQDHHDTIVRAGNEKTFDLVIEIAVKPSRFE